MYNWITVLSTWNGRNIVNQLYFNEEKKRIRIWMITFQQSDDHLDPSMPDSLLYGNILFLRGGVVDFYCV